MFETMKQVLSQTGQLVDERPEHLDGYLAERPDGLRDCIRVWSPCGCCWTYMSPNASVLTQCDSQSHDFDWKQAEEALNGLLLAEASSKKGEALGSDSQLAIIKLPKT